MKRTIWLFVLLMTVCTISSADMEVRQDKTFAVRYISDWRMAWQIVNDNDQEALISMITQGRIVFFNKKDRLSVVSDNQGFMELRKKGTTDTYFVDSQFLQFAKDE